MFTVGKKMEILCNKNEFTYIGDDVFKIFFSLFYSKKFQNFKKHLIFGFEANIL